MAISISAALVAAGWLGAAQFGLIGNLAINSPTTGGGQTGTQEQDPDKKVPSVNGTVAEAGDYKLSVRKVASVDGQKMDMDFDVSRIQMQTSGQTFGSPGAGGFAGGGGGGSGGTFFKPNVGLAVDIQPPDKKTDAIVELSRQIKAVDDKGNTLEFGSGPSKPHFWEFEKANPDSHPLYLYLKDQDAYMLTKLEGELLVTPGKIHLVEYDAKDTVTKKSGGKEFTYKAFTTSPGGFQVEVIFPPTTAQENAKSPPEKMQAFMKASMGAYSVSVEDSEGDIHFAAGSGSGGGSGGSSTGFSFGGGGGKGGGRVAGGPGGFVGGGGMMASSPAQTYRFKDLPEGRTLKKVRLKMVDSTGETKTIPFTLTDIRLK